MQGGGGAGKNGLFWSILSCGSVDVCLSVYLSEISVHDFSESVNKISTEARLAPSSTHNCKRVN